MEQTGWTLEKAVAECIRIKNDIENNNLTELKYELWKIKHGRHINNETAKYI